MSEDLCTLIDKLQSAVMLAMDPFTPPPIRREAYDLCEKFKEHEFCAHGGFHLANKERHHCVRHFGLQMVENSIKFRWNTMSLEHKQMIKSNALEFIRCGTLGIMEEHLHIKDALSRLVVEIAKREWPQQWSSMLDELDVICCCGPTQTELVLLVFLRLAEDVIVLQTAPVQRRREILQSLTALMPRLFPCFVRTLNSGFESLLHKDWQQASGESVKLMLMSLELLTTLVDWVQIGIIMDQNGLLLQLLCRIIGQVNEISVQLTAIDCLLVITGRKGKIEDRTPLMILYSEDAMSSIISVVQAALGAPVDERSFMFLKKLCLLFGSLGMLLGNLWGVVSDVGQPTTFAVFLETLIVFTQHPSQVLASYTQSVWTSFLRHPQIAVCDVIQKIIPRLLETNRKSLFRVGFPSSTNCPSSIFSRIDFDCDDDFNTFLYKFRPECAETVRWIASVYADVAFQYIVERIEEQLSKSSCGGVGVRDLDSAGLSPSSQPVLEWDVLSIFLESVMSRGIACERAQLPTDSGIGLVKKLIAFTCPDPFITSSLLTMISSLLPFVMNSPDLLPNVLERIYSEVIFTIPGQTKSARSKAVKNTRRHACSLIIKISKQFSSHLLPLFDHLCGHVKQLCSSEQELSQMEKCTLSEGLILISNHFNDFRKQESFIREVLTPVSLIWLSDSFRESLRSADKFMHFIGLTQPGVEPSNADLCGVNRSQVRSSQSVSLIQVVEIQYCIGIISGILKRCTWPEDLDLARQGGFVSGLTESGAPIFKNPAELPLFELLDNVLALCRTMHELWLPQNLTKRHPDFTNAFELMESERLMLLGIQSPLSDNQCIPVHKQPCERMQSFLTYAHETCILIIGSIGSSLGWSFYQTPNLAPTLANSFLANIALLPDYRLRFMTRSFLKPYVHECPKEFYSAAVLPILARVCPFMHELLQSKWLVVNQRCEEEDTGEDQNMATSEVLLEQAVRHLSREYIEFLVNILRDKKSGQMPETTDDMTVDEGDNATSKKLNEETIGELGLLFLQHNEIFPHIVLTLFSSLSWNDTTCCIKSAAMCFPLLKQIIALETITAEEADSFFLSVLVGLNLHGQHEGAQSRLLQTTLDIYELLRPQYPSIQQIMLKISSCSENDLQLFDKKVFVTAPQKPLGDKKKKEMFKSLVTDAIGKNIGQHFRQEVTIRNLAPNTFRSQRYKPPSLVDTEQHDIGLCALFTPVNQ